MTEPATPTISVLLPAYNTERYVAAAVDSILAQTFRDFELLIIDDGSIDRTAEVVRRVVGDDPRVRFRSRANTGYVVALNEMLSESRGEFIARMDADDISLPTRFEEQLAYLRENPECLVVGTQVTHIDPQGRPLVVSSSPTSHEEIDAANVRGPVAHLWHPSVLMRRSLFDLTPPYDPELFGAEDLDLWLRAAEVGRLANLPAPLVQYRHHNTKVSVTHCKRQRDAANESITRAWRRRNLEGHPRQPVSSALSSAVQRRNWAWWALSSGHVSTARAHALAAVGGQPLSVENWRALACAVRGH